MGICRHCGKEIILKDNEKNCPNCGMPPYNCWNCHNEITGETKECHVCKFFICPSCGVCGTECDLPLHIQQIIGKTTRQIVEYFYNLKSGKVRMNCHKGIPITYGKIELRNMAIKLRGFHTRDERDMVDFEERLTRVKNFPIGKTWTINKERESGFNGKELRIVSNMGVCMGFIIKKRIKDEIKNIEYDLYERVEEKKPCRYANWNSLIVWACSKNSCGKTYSDKYITCCVYTKGKKKGQKYELVERLSHLPFCQKPKLTFEVKEED